MIIMLTISDNKHELWYTNDRVLQANCMPVTDKAEDARPTPIFRPNEGCPDLDAAFPAWKPLSARP